MAFIRQRIAGVFLIVGLLCSWVGLTSLVIRQAVLVPGQFTTYAYKALDNPVIREQVAGVMASSIRNSNSLLKIIPEPNLKSAIDSSLTKPAVKTEFANVAFDIQQHVLGLQSGPVVLGGPALSQAVAQSIASSNPVEEQLIAKIPISYTIKSSSIPSLAKYYSQLNSTIKVTLFGAAATLLASLVVAAKKRKTLRKIGIAFIGFSAFEVAGFWLTRKYLLPHIHSGPLVIISAILTASSNSIEPIYLGALGTGIALNIVSFLV